MLEIEQKFAGADFAALEARLAEWGARRGEEHVESDHYFNAPDRDFAVTGEAFRLRRIGSANYLTYKGQRQPGPVKVRPELEIALRDGDTPADEMTRLLKHLGYRPVAVVRKQRRHYHLSRDGFDLTICLDDVDGLGRYAEVEVLADETKADAARVVLEAAARGLGLTALEQRSYLTMLLAK